MFHHNIGDGHSEGGRAMFNHWHDLLEWIQAVMTCRQKEGPCQKKVDAENKAHKLIEIERTCQGLLQAIVGGLKFTSPFLYIRSVEGRRHHRRLERHLHLPPARKSTRESTSLSAQCLASPSFSGLNRPSAMAFTLW
jgi:hypothetical protein